LSESAVLNDYTITLSACCCTEQTSLADTVMSIGDIYNLFCRLFEQYKISTQNLVHNGGLNNRKHSFTEFTE